MKKLDYYVLDVFTKSPYQGNQLSVIYEETPLDIDQYHNISREFGYSETSFVHYSVKDKIFKVRSFTPAKFEVEGAGHNLLGAVCLALLKGWEIFKEQTDELAVMVSNTRIAIKVSDENGTPYVGMKQSQAKILGTVPVDLVSAALGLLPDEIASTGIPINIVSTEVPHLMVPVKDLSILKRATPDKTRLKALSTKYGFEGFYLFALGQLSEDCLAETRFFNPGIGIDEDPATGTAAGPLAGYLVDLSLIEREKNYLIVQGKYIDHPSFIRVNVQDDGIWVSGSSVIVMEGKLII